MSAQAFRISFVVSSRRFKKVLDALGDVEELKIEAVSAAKRKQTTTTAVEHTKTGKLALATLRDHGESVLTPGTAREELNRAFVAAGFSADSVSPVLSKLIRSGKVVRIAFNKWKLA